MKSNRAPTPAVAPIKRCAVYTRKSSGEGLEQAYNSLEAQRDAGLALVASQSSGQNAFSSDRFTAESGQTKGD